MAVYGTDTHTHTHFSGTLRAIEFNRYAEPRIITTISYTVMYQFETTAR